MSDATDLLDRNWHDFHRLLDRCESQLRRGRHEQAAAAALIAATFAWCNHTGSFASGRLADVLSSLAGTLPRIPEEPRVPAGGTVRLLHVASQLYDTGGHTQMLANWLRLDGVRDHHVVVTSQDGRPIPDKIIAALPEPDALTQLDVPFRGLMERAEVLRGLAAGFDHVVLHVHPNEVVAPIALGRRAGGAPEVLLVNHADHCFWEGGRAADRVVNLRHSGALLNRDRRGVPDGRNTLLVRPLHLQPRALPREQARAALGIDPGVMLVVSAADRYKYVAADGPALLDAVLPLLRSAADVRLHVAGPDVDGPWSVLAKEGLGRAWGVLPDVRPLLEAADVYLDSYPFSSLTSMLEAASLEVPVVTLQTGGADSAVLGADTPELDDQMVVANSEEELRSALSSLLVRPTERETLGRATAATVMRTHAGGAWVEQVDRVLGAPHVDGLPIRPEDAPRETGELDQRLLRVMQNGVGRGVPGVLDLVAPVLPWPRRVETALRLLRRRRFRPVLLLPAPRERAVRRFLGGRRRVVRT